MNFSFEEIYKLIFERSDFGITVIDIDGHIVLANPRFLRMLDYSEREIIKMTLKDIIYPEDLEEVLTELRGLSRYLCKLPGIIL